LSCGLLFCLVIFLPGAARPFSCRLSCAAFLFDFATIDGGAGASGQTSPWRDSTAAQDEPGLEDVEPLLGGEVWGRVVCWAGGEWERGRCPAPAQSCLPPDGLVPRLASAKRQMQSQPRKPDHKPLREWACLLRGPTSSALPEPWFHHGRPPHMHTTSLYTLPTGGKIPCARLLPPYHYHARRIS
jgi:hypothetical protein